MTTPPNYIGNYKVLRPLGEGHFGVVWLAEGQVPARGSRPAKQRTVAIKQLRGAWSMRHFETLVHEFELLDRVKHRSICKVYEFLDRENAVVMEHVQGITLRALIDGLADAEERIWPEAAIEIGCELADCLYQAHVSPGPSGDPLGLVHRDLKPENVMVTASGEVRVLDFGLAAIAEDSSDIGIKGTPLYMAPEQSRGGAIDHRTDLFAVGLLLFELLMGDAAYPLPSRDGDSSIDALMERIDRADLGDELHRLCGTLPRVGAVVASCLKAAPEQRPTDGHVLLLALRGCRGPEARGALAEFCSYAFGPTGPLAEPRPAGMGDMMTGTDRASRSVEGPPSMSRNPETPRPGAPPRPGAARPSKDGRPRPQAASRPSGKPPPGREMWTPSEKPKGPTPMASKPEDLPGEDLRMVPLVDENSDPELGDGVHHGSTQFFARPKPATGPPEAVTPLRKVDPIAQASAPLQPHAPPPSAAPGMVPHGAVPPGHIQPVAHIGIQGPVAAGPTTGAPYGGIPMGAQLPPDHSQEIHRAQSYRVFAIVIGLMFMVFAVLSVTVILTVYGLYMLEQQPEEKEKNVAVIPPPPPAPMDTGVAKPPPPPPAPTVRPKSRPTGGGQAPAPQPEEPAPATDPAAITISLDPGSPPFSSVEVKCPSGFRERGVFAGGKVTIPAVPRESCEAFFKGGPPSKTRLSGGDSKTCSFVGVAANCR